MFYCFYKYKYLFFKYLNILIYKKKHQQVTGVVIESNSGEKMYLKFEKNP